MDTNYLIHILTLMRSTFIFMNIITTWGIAMVVEFLGKDIHHCPRYMHNHIVWVPLSVPNWVKFVCNTHEVTKGTSFFTK